MQEKVDNPRITSPTTLEYKLNRSLPYWLGCFQPVFDRGVRSRRLISTPDWGKLLYQGNIKEKDPPTAFICLKYLFCSCFVAVDNG